MIIEKILSAATVKMRGAIDLGKHKQVTLGLLFLRSASVASNGHRYGVCFDDEIELSHGQVTP